MSHGEPITIEREPRPYDTAIGYRPALRIATDGTVEACSAAFPHLFDAIARHVEEAPYTMVSSPIIMHILRETGWASPGEDTPLACDVEIYTPPPAGGTWVASVGTHEYGIRFNHTTIDQLESGHACVMVCRNKELYLWDPNGRRPESLIDPFYRFVETQVCNFCNARCGGGYSVASQPADEHPQLALRDGFCKSLSALKMAEVALAQRFAWPTVIKEISAQAAKEDPFAHNSGLRTETRALFHRGLQHLWAIDPDVFNAFSPLPESPDDLRKEQFAGINRMTTINLCVEKCAEEGRVWKINKVCSRDTRQPIATASKYNLSKFTTEFECTLKNVIDHLAKETTTTEQLKSLAHLVDPTDVSCYAVLTEMYTADEDDQENIVERFGHPLVEIVDSEIIDSRPSKSGRSIQNTYSMSAAFLPAVFKHLKMKAPIFTAERVKRKKLRDKDVVRVCEMIGNQMAQATYKRWLGYQDPSMYTDAPQWCWDGEDGSYGRVTVTWDTGLLSLPDFIDALLLRPAASEAAAEAAFCDA